jgi:hypothetical protein
LDKGKEESGLVSRKVSMEDLPDFIRNNPVGVFNSDGALHKVFKNEHDAEEYRGYDYRVKIILDAFEDMLKKFEQQEIDRYEACTYLQIFVCEEIGG